MCLGTFSDLMLDIDYALLVEVVLILCSILAAYIVDICLRRAPEFNMNFDRKKTSGRGPKTLKDLGSFLMNRDEMLEMFSRNIGRLSRSQEESPDRPVKLDKSLQGIQCPEFQFEEIQETDDDYVTADEYSSSTNPSGKPDASSSTTRLKPAPEQRVFGALNKALSSIGGGPKKVRRKTTDGHAYFGALRLKIIHAVI